MVQVALTTFRSFASASIYILHPGFKFFSYSYNIYFILCQWVLYEFDNIVSVMNTHLNFMMQKPQIQKQNYENAAAQNQKNRHQPDPG